GAGAAACRGGSGGSVTTSCASASAAAAALAAFSAASSARNRSTLEACGSSFTAGFWTSARTNRGPGPPGSSTAFSTNRRPSSAPPVIVKYFNKLGIMSTTAAGLAGTQTRKKCRCSAARSRSLVAPSYGKVRQEVSTSGQI